MPVVVREVDVEYRCGHASKIQARVATLQEVAQVREAIRTRLCYECQLKRATGELPPRPRSGGGYTSRWSERDRSRR